MRIAFLMRILETGGTERQATLLMQELARRGHEITLFVFYARGPFLDVVKDSGITVVDLEKSGRWDSIAFITRTLRLIRDYDPEVLYSFLSIPNAVSAMISMALPNTLVVWGVRGQRVTLKDSSWLRYVSERAALLFSAGADLVTVNSKALVDDCLAGGCLPPFEVVYNGLPASLEDGSGISRQEVRQQLGIPEGDTVLCHVSRLAPVKDIPTLFEAYSRFLKQSGRTDVRMLIVGGDRKPWLDNARRACKDAGVCANTVFAGPQRDVRPYLSASDIFVLSSRLESFPNSLLEAAAYGLMCITTDVGDAAEIVQDYGFVVPPEDPKAMSVAMMEAVERLKSGSWNRDAQISYIRGRFTRQALARRVEDMLQYYMESKRRGKLTLKARLRMRLSGSVSLMDEDGRQDGREGF